MSDTAESLRAELISILLQLERSSHVPPDFGSAALLQELRTAAALVVQKLEKPFQRTLAQKFARNAAISFVSATQRCRHVKADKGFAYGVTEVLRQLAEIGGDPERESVAVIALRAALELGRVALLGQQKNRILCEEALSRIGKVRSSLTVQQLVEEWKRRTCDEQQWTSGGIAHSEEQVDIVLEPADENLARQARDEAQAWKIQANIMLKKAERDLASGAISDVEFAKLYVRATMAMEKREVSSVKAVRHVSFSSQAPTVYETYSGDEYERAMPLMLQLDDKEDTEPTLGSLLGSITSIF